MVKARFAANSKAAIALNRMIIILILAAIVILIASYFFFKKLPTMIPGPPI